MYSLNRRLFAEFTGTLLLLATVIGSGIMGERLAGGNVAIALFCNVTAICAMLVVLITMLAPVSGAHFNPAVTLLIAMKRQLPVRQAVAYTAVQVAGAVAGVWLAHAMFGEVILQTSLKVRAGPGQWLSEGVATFGLILTIFATHRTRPDFVPAAVSLYIMAACWFTASASFANPAVTLARSLSNTFAGIRPVDAPAFIAAQFAGALLGLWVCTWFLKPETHA